MKRLCTCSVRIGLLVIRSELHSFVLKLRARLILDKQDSCCIPGGKVSSLVFSGDKMGSENVSEIDRERD